MDLVFKALADESRRRLLDRLNRQNGQSLQELCADLGMTRQSVSKHLAALEAANLVTTMRRGRRKLHFLNPEPINAIADRWISRYDRARIEALADLKTALEHPGMTAAGADGNAFVYVTYIDTTPERLWQALTDPAFTSRYWGSTFDAELVPGANMVWHYLGVTMTDPEQVILAAEPGKRLAYTWHTFTPEWAAACGFDEAQRATFIAGPRSKVSFEIEQTEFGVKLTVVHDGFEPGSPVLESVSGGWPLILSGLKTLLETGALAYAESAG
jgi:uncharacterized protein YndB with AHSA1/START domain/DNA-binding transcriptional ArsR family regulator